MTGPDTLSQTVWSWAGRRPGEGTGVYRLPIQGKTITDMDSQTSSLSTPEDELISGINGIQGLC